MSEIDYRFQKSVSYSQYSLFNQCPHQWYLKYVKKIKDDKPSIHLVFGTSMHETLQMFFEVMYNKSLKKAEELDLIGDFKDRFLKIYKETLKKNKGQHFSSSEEMREFFDDGVSIIEWFLKKRSKYFSKKGTELIGIEIPLQTLANREINNVFFNGFIDLLLYDKVLNRYTIYDIKTSTRGWSDKEKKDQTKINQILLYKKFLSQLKAIPEENIDVVFFIVKRKIFESDEFIIPRIQQFKPTHGKIKIKQAYESFSNFLLECFNADGTYKELEYPKNVTKLCNWCPFNTKPELCDKNGENKNKFFV
jgi:hypothetical protein